MRAFIWSVAVTAAVAAHACPAQAAAPGPFWKSVQATCDATAAKPASDLGKRIAQTALDEFNRFDGHQIDSNGRLFHFGLTEAKHREGVDAGPQDNVGNLRWWRVMKYWRALFGDKDADYAGKIEVRGYKGASSATQEKQQAELVRPSADDLLRAVDDVKDPDVREVLRETILRAAAIDTPWSAAFLSYVMKEAGVSPNAFSFANAHRAYIYDAFATSIAEQDKKPSDKLYRACPLSVRPRAGDILCFQRESTLKDASDEAVRERIRGELTGNSEARSIRSTHCDVVVSVDTGARKLYSIGGNVAQSVTARKLNLTRQMKLSEWQGECGAGEWNLPKPADGGPRRPDHCSISDQRWFVLLQLR